MNVFGAGGVFLGEGVSVLTRRPTDGGWMPVDFAEFVQGRTAALLRFAYLLTGDNHLAEDLVQEALVRAHRRWSSIVHEDGPEPYVRKAVLRQYLSWRRKKSTGELPVADVPDSASVDELESRVVQADEMWAMLGTLSRAQRAVMILRYYEDLPDGDVARLLNCSPATVRVHAFNALGKLRTVVKPAGLPGGRA
jgi:RNA polymerase sigma-70 factor (sigma-E family)